MKIYLKGGSIVKRGFIIFGIILFASLFVSLTSVAAGEVEDLYNYCNTKCMPSRVECDNACQEALVRDQNCYDRCTELLLECWEKCMAVEKPPVEKPPEGKPPEEKLPEEKPPQEKPTPTPISKPESKPSVSPTKNLPSKQVEKEAEKLPPTSEPLSTPEPTIKPETVYVYGSNGSSPQYVELDKLLEEMKVGESKQISIKSPQGYEVKAKIVSTGDGKHLIIGPNGTPYDWENRKKALSQSIINKVVNGYKNGRDNLLAKVSGIDPDLYKQIQDHYQRENEHQSKLKTGLKKALWWVFDKVSSPVVKVVKTGLNALGTASTESQINTCYKKYKQFMDDPAGANGDHNEAMKLLKDHTWRAGDPYRFASVGTDYDKNKEPGELAKILKRAYYVTKKD